MRKKSPYRKLVWLILVIGVIFFLGIWYWNYLQSPVDKNSEIEAFVVPQGASITSIADDLESQGFIRSSAIFKYLYRNKNSDIEAGDFKLSKAMTMSEIIKTLTEGSIDKWVTLLEGWRVEQIANKLNSELGIQNSEFLSVAKEGYMFPDTYLFNPDASSATIASIMENTFNQRYTTELQNKIKSQGLTPEQGVILASLVEREARSDKVRTEVASVILKRLKMGMKLDIDATVQYAKDSQKLKQNPEFNDFWKPVSQADYTGVMSPYNTYLNPGLPPTAIANPSLSALNAVANADANTPYIYYYHDSKGNTYYAKTLEEHNANVARYR